jgi:hypothetical protein
MVIRRRDIDVADLEGLVVSRLAAREATRLVQLAEER